MRLYTTREAVAQTDPSWKAFRRRTHRFTEDYYVRGPETGLSNYENYRYIPEISRPNVWRLQEHTGITSGMDVLDVGASRGYTVKVLRENNVNAFGYDISEWAVEHCDAAVRDCMSTDLANLPHEYDWVVSKDTLEHIPPDELKTLVPHLLNSIRIGMFVIVPLTEKNGGPYLYPPDNTDATHIIRWPLESWIQFFHESARKSDGNFIVTAEYHVDGLKRASAEYPASTGFFTVKRVTTERR